MNYILRIIILLCGLSFAGIILHLLIKNKINEKNSIVWLLGAFLTLGLSIAPQALDKFTVLIGVDYPPAFLYLVATLIILLCILYYSIQISDLQAKLNKLTQVVAVYKAIEEKRHDELEDK